MEDYLIIIYDHATLPVRIAISEVNQYLYKALYSGPNILSYVRLDKRIKHLETANMDMARKAMVRGDASTVMSVLLRLGVDRIYEMGPVTLPVVVKLFDYKFMIKLFGTCSHVSHKKCPIDNLQSGFIITCYVSCKKNMVQSKYNLKTLRKCYFIMGEDLCSNVSDAIIDSQEYKDGLIPDPADYDLM